MSQHDLSIANQGFPAFRSDLNDALQALGSMQSGTSAPSTTYANQLWYDTTNNIVKMRNEDNDAWISLFTLDQSADEIASVLVGSGSASAPSIADVGDTNTGILFPAADTVAVSTGGTERVRVDSSGNVGVGVTPSAWYSSYKALQIKTSALSAWGNNEVYLMSNAYGDTSSTYKYLATGSKATSYVQYEGTHSWNTAASGTAGNAITFTQAMTLDASGNLALGVTSVTGGYRAQINGNLLLGTTANPLLVGTTSLNFLGDNTSSYGMRLDSSGNLLVGTTSTSVTSGGLTSQFAGGESYFNIGHKSGTSSGAYFGAFSYNGSIIGGVTQNGTTGVLYNLTSDYRLKNDPQPLTGAKEFVMALQPKKWQWWDGSGEGVGFIAHEFMEVAKYSGNGEKDAVDENGNPVYQSIQPSSSEVMAYLVAHIQNLETRLAALEQA